MICRKTSFFFVALLAVVFMAASGPSTKSEARSSSKSASLDSGAKPQRKSQKPPGKKKKRRAKASKRKSSREKAFRGHGIDDDLPSGELKRPSGDLWVFSENMREEVRVNIYHSDGEFDDQALAKLDHEFRCRRTGEERAVDPRLYETLSRIQDHFGGKQIHLVSGFRFQRNEGSRHYHASAMDIRIPGVPIRKLRAYAESLDRGGMGIGIYPNSNFVHVDFRAPGEPSYRWVDRSGPGGKAAGKRRSRRFKRRSPNS